MPTAQNRTVVLDAWPVIEHYEGNDPVSAQLEALLARRRPRPVMSAATFTEVQYTLANRHGSDTAEHQARDLLHLVRVEPLDTPTATTAARIKHTYRMSLGDAFAAATAIRHRALPDPRAPLCQQTQRTEMPGRRTGRYLCQPRGLGQGGVLGDAEQKILGKPEYRLRRRFPL